MGRCQKLNAKADKSRRIRLEPFAKGNQFIGDPQRRSGEQVWFTDHLISIPVVVPYSL
jgi:hypothetical protein